MELAFITVGVAIIMAFPVLRLLYMDQQFETYLSKIKHICDKTHESNDQHGVKNATSMWKDALTVSEKNRTSIRYDFLMVFGILIFGALTMNGIFDFGSDCCIEMYFSMGLGIVGGIVFGTFMNSFMSMNRIKKDVNEIIFEIFCCTKIRSA